MAIQTYQPQLPPEGPFTDPELNFIDESPRGFFPANQDSNWGWKRKVFTDQIQELFNQLNIIYGEVFPQTSSLYLDEWEEALGLPQNPPNKTLEQRRTMVLNRLRGGPFTRKQRREIVESYIRATFGDPIKLLPAGVEMLVAGQPLYNEPGDMASLYSILETITAFTYEVRIQSGLAIDQLGLERDLRWFTPAGLTIIFNYSWLSKTGTDAGVGTDTINASTGAAFKISVFDVGTSSEGVRFTAADTGVGVDAGSSGRLASDTGSGTETSTAVVATSTSEGGVGMERVGRVVNLSEIGSSADSGAATGGPRIDSFTPTTGPVNTIVTITGAGFTGTTAVKFGGTNAATFMVDSDTQVRAIAQTSGLVLVQTPKGSFTTTGSFTVH